MSQDNAAQEFYLLLDANEPARAKRPPACPRRSGPGLLLAVLVSIVLWIGLVWIAAQVGSLLS